MYRKILVPLDGSQRAESVLPHVKGLAAQNSATVVLLSVLEPAVVTVSPFDSNLEASADKARLEEDRTGEYLSDLERALEADGINTQHQVERGPVVRTILEVVDSDGFDLIVMASHGRTGLSRVLHGSVTTGVLNGVTQPLLLIRAT